WYILAGRPIPAAGQYDGYPQLENGVGMVRQLLDEASRTARKLPARLDKPVSATLVCGEMIGPHLSAALEPLRNVENLDLRLLVVKNNTLGGNVSCSGLLFGDEVVSALRTHSGDRGSGIGDRGRRKTPIPTPA